MCYPITHHLQRLTTTLLRWAYIKIPSLRRASGLCLAVAVWALVHPAHLVPLCPKTANTTEFSMWHGMHTGAFVQRTHILNSADHTLHSVLQFATPRLQQNNEVTEHTEACAV